jgi:hypothetical protein
MYDQNQPLDVRKKSISQYFRVSENCHLFKACFVLGCRYAALPERMLKF